MIALAVHPHVDAERPFIDESEGRYCGNRCGFHCSREKFDYAQRRARELAERMGEGWQPIVWENWGWNWRVARGDAAIYPNEDKRKGFVGNYPVTSYTCYLNVSATVQDCGPNNGGSAVQFISRADEPEDALGFAVQKARTCIARIEESLEKLQ